jgi:YHS domain-containing protein
MWVSLIQRNSWKPAAFLEARVFIERKEVILMVKDPVCGMDVDPKTAAGKSEYKGQEYYFCSPGCKKAFDKEPEKYVKAEAQ